MKESNPKLDSELAEQFDEHVKSVMYDLSVRLKSNLPDYAVNTNIVKV